MVVFTQKNPTSQLNSNQLYVPKVLGRLFFILQPENAGFSKFMINEKNFLLPSYFKKLTLW